MGAGRANTSCEHVGHSPKKRPMLDRMACTRLPPTPPAFRLREAGKEAMWLLDQVDRKAGKQSGRIPRDYFQNSPRRGTDSSLLLVCLPRPPAPFPSALFPSVPNPLPGSRSQDEPLHSPRCHKHQSRSRETKRCPPFVLRKGAMGPEDGRDVDREQRKGVREGGIRAGGDSALAGEEAYPSLSKHQARYLRRKKSCFGFLAAPGHHRPKRVWAGGRGLHM